MQAIREMHGSRSSVCTVKQPYLSPKSPSPKIPPSYVGYNSAHLGPIGTPTTREGHRHQHTSSVSILIDEQPSWLDDLLNEPDSPVGKGAHKRSSSDSFAYVHTSNVSSNLAHDGFNDQHLQGLQHPHCIGENSSRMLQNRRHELTLSNVNYLGRNGSFVKKKIIRHPGPISTTKEPEALGCEQFHEESAQDMKESSEKKEDAHEKQAQSELEIKQVKRQFAQRSRVRKLQYIAELERNVHALQAEGFEIPAEIEFLSQQNHLLSLENTALKQRLDSLSQEHIIKCFEQEMLEREISRLRGFPHHCQQQRQQQQHPQQQMQRQRQHRNRASNHRRSNSRDLGSQFSNLPSQQKDSSSKQDPVADPLHT
ncbi:uncharacterized protein A4U43_C10F9490 [Asparagus officinalis]|uniref:BZIP domain-containing protein n=1 Tax=Asparagus officinalis TaxID=4686 RepID=A0A5P1E1P4_ASPOF|nr:uncharacterized protein At4g06598-like [Asparagus officinalis]ONK56504.1 uncharacterized protein A4U43_C10F9490 [Asparagus officinalis]